ncbi:hypothetical protein AB2B41_20450 [Marimonas sp. MJW-29]|uniref:Uncharacterized protein n=1 Tax=Sulfitobacter sediminis TaxID=3234186 RepID=A0ABV3RSL4_9RHOB
MSQAAIYRDTPKFPFPIYKGVTRLSSGAQTAELTAGLKEMLGHKDQVAVRVVAD